jgi:menaquinone-dependent protoporphyrinogen oxidase
MSKLLIVYGTGDGQTLKIAERIGEIARAQKFEVDGINAADHPPSDFSISPYRGIIVGSSLRNRKYNSYVIEFIQDCKADLQRCPSAFFSVSIGDATFMRKGVDKLVNKFFDEMGWHPKTVGRFAGALKYTKYDFWTKFFMSIAGWVARYPTDTRKDHELTDWEQVEKFTNEFLESVKGQELSPTT